MDSSEGGSESGRSVRSPTEIWSGSRRDEHNPPRERARRESCAARRLQGAQVGESGRPRNSRKRRFARNPLLAALFARSSERFSAIAGAQRLYRSTTAGSSPAISGPSSPLSEKT